MEDLADKEELVPIPRIGAGAAAFVAAAPALDYVRLVEEDGDALILLDPDARIRFVNRRAEAILGRTRDSLLGRRIWDEFPGSETNAAGAAVKRALAEQRAVTVEYPALLTPGIWYEARCVPYGGEDEGGVIVYLSDVTDRRRAEADRDAAEAARRDSDLRLRVALEAAQMVAWEWDLSAVKDPAQDLVTNASARADLWGAISGPAEGFLARVHPDDRTAVRAAVLDALAAPGGGDAHAPDYGVEFRLLGQNGSYRWMAARGHVVREVGTGRPLRIGGVRWDVEDRKRAEEAALAAAAEQERIAETLQRALLIKPPPSAFPGLEVHTAYEAAHHDLLVGGDFFDAFALPDGRVALVVGDVTGKGLSAATETADIKFTLRAFLREHRGDAATALERLNSHLIEGRHLDGKPDDVFVCLSMVVLDPATGRGAALVAGGEAPLLVRCSGSGGCGEAAADAAPGAMLGALPEWAGGCGAQSGAFELAPGDLLLLYTDGLTEARRGRDEFWGAEGVAGAASRAAAQEGGEPGAVAAGVIAGARKFAGGELRDDVCLLLVRRHATSDNGVSRSR